MSAILLAFVGRFGFYIAGAAGVIVAYFAWSKHIENKGVTKERVRVETVGKKIDAKARDARRAAERDPPASLRKYFRD